MQDLAPDMQAILYDSDTTIICANWDRVFWEDSRLENLIQVHGLCLYPESMIWPVEFVSDLSRDDGVTRHMAFDVPPDCIAALKDAHRKMLEALENCENIYSWGFALNAYDAELMALLATVAKRDPKVKLTVINPDIIAGCRLAAIMKVYEFTLLDPEMKTRELLSVGDILKAGSVKKLLGRPRPASQI